MWYKRPRLWRAPPFFLCQPNTKRTERRDGDVRVKNYAIDSQFFFYFSYSSFRELDSGRRLRMINGARGPKRSSWLLLLLVRVGQKKCMKAE